MDARNEWSVAGTPVSLRVRLRPRRGCWRLHWLLLRARPSSGLLEQSLAIITLSLALEHDSCSKARVRHKGGRGRGGVVSGSGALPWGLVAGTGASVVGAVGGV